MKGIERGSSRAAGYFLSILLLLSFSFSFHHRFIFIFLCPVRSGKLRSTRIHKGAFVVLFSLRFSLVDFLESGQEEKGKTNCLEKSSRCSRMCRPESPKSGPRGMDIGDCLFCKGNRLTETGESETREEECVKWRLASGCKNSRVTSQVTVST